MGAMSIAVGEVMQMKNTWKNIERLLLRSKYGIFYAYLMLFVVVWLTDGIGCFFNSTEPFCVLISVGFSAVMVAIFYYGMKSSDCEQSATEVKKNHIVVLLDVIKRFLPYIAIITVFAAVLTLCIILL